MVVEPLRKNTKRWLKLDREYYIEHLAYDSILKCFEQHLKYAKIEAEERIKRGEKFNFWKMIWEIKRKFLIDFIYRSAWKDGFSCMIYSFVSELMILQIHLFLWEKNTKNLNSVSIK